MKIVFLDSHTLNPGDLDWEPLRQFGEFITYQRTTPQQTLSRAADAEVIITNKVRLDEEHFSRLPGLRLVLVAATGYDSVDAQAARTYGIDVCNCPAYATQAVAQHTLALLLEATNRAGFYAAANQGVTTAESAWQESKDFSCWTHPLTELFGLRAAIVGWGAIGGAVGNLFSALGMEVYAVSSKPQSDLPTQVEKLTLQEAFRTCQVVSLHCPLCSDTHHMVDKNLLSLARPELILLNTARGQLVDEAHIAQALHDKKLSAYCTDVLSLEPPSSDNPLLGEPRAFITPHVAWASLQARQRILKILSQELAAHLHGDTLNLVNM